VVAQPCTLSSLPRLGKEQYDHLPALTAPDDPIPSFGGGGAPDWPRTSTLAGSVTIGREIGTPVRSRRLIRHRAPPASKRMLATSMSDTS
jgi:hypothetical protein